MNIKYDDIVQPILDELRGFQTCYSKELYMSFKDRFEGLKPKIEASLQEGRALKIGNKVLKLFFTVKRTGKILLY